MLLLSLGVLGVLLMVPFSIAPLRTTYALVPLVPVLALSPFSSRTRYYLRLFIYIAGLGITSAWGVLVASALSLVGRKKDVNYVIARSFYYFVGPLLGIRFHIEGAHHLDTRRPYVAVGNHQSMVDILYLGAVFPRACSIMAKRELKYMPLLGQYIAMANNFFIDRKDHKDALRVFRDVTASMKERETSLFVFAEGTRNNSSTPALLPFKKGPFYCATQGNMPIIPIVCENYSHAYSGPLKRFEAQDIRIRVLAPIETDKFEASSDQVSQLSEQVRSRMLEELEDMYKSKMIAK